MDGSCDKDEDSEGKLLDLITQNNLTFAFFISDLFSRILFSAFEVLNFFRLCLALLKNSFFSLMKEIFWSVKQEIKIELDWWCGKWQRWRIRRWGHCFLITHSNLTLAFSFQTYFLCLVLLKNSFFSLMKEIFWSVKQEIKIELDWWCGKWQRWRIRRWGHCFLITHSNLTLAFSFQTYFLCLVLLKNSFFSLMKEIFWSVKQEIKIELDWSKMDHAVSNKDEDYEGEVIVS